MPEYTISTNTGGPLYHWMQTSPVPQAIGRVGETVNKALMAFDPTQSIPYIVSQQPRVQQWMSEHPETADTLQGLSQLILGHGMSQAAIPFRVGTPRVPQEVLDKLINQRNRLFHATQPEYAQAIIESGQINPSRNSIEFQEHAPRNIVKQYNTIQENVDRLHDLKYANNLFDMADPKYRDIEQQLQSLYNQQNTILKSWGEMLESPRLLNQVRGVSVSRTPKAVSHPYGYAPITFELEPTKLPTNRPIAEAGWRKTTASRVNPERESIPNIQFEFENRTYNQPIPTSAISKIMVDRSAYLDRPSVMETAQPLAEKLGVPVELYPTARAMNQYRARLGADTLKRLLGAK
jgi:hypothetical protein